MASANELKSLTFVKGKIMYAAFTFFSHFANDFVADLSTEQKVTKLGKG